MKLSKPTATVALFAIPVAVSLGIGYWNGDLRWGLINGVIVGAVFAVLGLLGVFQ